VQLDRAVFLKKANPRVLYYVSQIFAALGLAEAAHDLARPPPGWLRRGAPAMARLKSSRPLIDYPGDMVAADAMVNQGRLVSGTVRFALIAAANPGNELAWSSYSLALESIGAYKTAAKAVGKQLAANRGGSDKERKLLAMFKEDLQSRPPLVPEPRMELTDLLKGRYLISLGGGLNGSKTLDTIYNATGRLGKYFTNRFDVGITFGYVKGFSDADFNGGSLGVSARLNFPLPISYPLSLTAGARWGLVPGPSDNTSANLTGGLTYFMRGSALDLFLDHPVSGPSTGRKTLSLAYTIYLGGKAQ